MYSSYSLGAIDEGVLRQILDDARPRNARLGITGVLLYRQGRFYQYLEGPEPEVRALYESIRRDSRHDRLRVLMERPIAQRTFPEWSMGYEPLRRSQEPLPSGMRSTFVDLEDTDHPEHVLRAITELSYWYRARASRAERIESA